MRISDWSSDVCSSDLNDHDHSPDQQPGQCQFQQRLADQAAILADAFGRGGIHHAKYCTYDQARVRTSYRSTPDVDPATATIDTIDRKSTRLNSSHYCASRMPSSA